MTSRPSTTVPRHRHRRITTGRRDSVAGPTRPAQPPAWPAGPRPRPPARPARPLLRPRHWRVRTKLGAVLVIPAVAFVVVAGLLIGSSVRQAAALSELADQVVLAEQVAALAHELQFERDRLSGELAAVAAAPALTRNRLGPATLLAASRTGVRQERAAFDRAALPLRQRPGLAGPLAQATAALDELAVVHTGVSEGWLRQEAVFDGYTRAIEALHAVLRAPVAVTGVADLTGVAGVDEAGVRGYQELAELKEISAQIRGQVYAIARAGEVEPAALARLVDARAQRGAAQERFRAGATGPQLARFDEVVRGQAVRASTRLEQVVLDQAGSGTLTVDPEQWWAASTTELELIRDVEAVLLAQARDQVGQRSRDQWRATGLLAGGTVAILLVSLLMSIGIGRSMARSLRRLRGQAMEVAQVQLPGLLSRLRGSAGPVPAVDEVVPVSAGGADEVGDVADAFTQVHRSAVDLAVEQAVMRRNVNAIFVNLARRSQVLVERQLELLDELERDEAEPAQLRNLFRLDHLATRMRRNNESLLVLTGSDATRPYLRPVPVTAVAVAAIAEIEQYERVREDVASDLYVVGRAVADLVHLLAELLDNATTFSARDTLVTLVGQQLAGDAGALFEITDSGLGMSPAAAAAANAVLSEPPAIDVAASERMGLVVVGHLAARHGIRVQLSPRPRQLDAGPGRVRAGVEAAPSGVRASVWLPGTLLTPPAPGDEPFPVRQPALAAPAGDAAGRRAVRAKDVLAGTGTGGEPASAWWSPDGAAAVVAATDSGAAALLASPTPVIAGTSAHGLPIRRPQAHLLPGLLAGRAGAPDRPAGWVAGDLDPEEVGTTLSRFYGGVRRAESEEENEDGEPEQGSA